VPEKNKSEMLLEGYLRSHGYSDFDFEPDIPARQGVLTTDSVGKVARFASKSKSRGTAEDFKSGFGSFDPYPRRLLSCSSASIASSIDS
jgi:hypothetical protein